MNTQLVKVILAAATAMALVACGSSVESSKKRFSVVLTSVSDDGTPLQGTRFLTAKTAIGATDDKGRLSVRLTGIEGQSVPLTVICSEGYVSPEEAPVLRLREVRKVSQVGASSLKVDAVCDRKLRDVLVVVRTADAPSLPVDLAGKTIGETSPDGTAHFHLSLDREVRSLSVSLQTASVPGLRPQNPSRVFELDGRDAVLLVDQSFTTERSTRTKRAATRPTLGPKKRVPDRIDPARFRAL